MGYPLNIFRSRHLVDSSYIAETASQIEPPAKITYTANMKQKTKGNFSISPRLTCYFAVAVWLFGCSAPRSVMQSGKVTPKGKFNTGASFTVNVPIATSDVMISGLKEVVELIVDEVEGTDSAVYTDNVAKATEAVVIYSIDPASGGTGFHLRFGVWDNIDIGFNYASGVKAFDTRFQFMGESHSRKSGYSGKRFGSIGIQYASQSYEMPSFLGKLQDVLHYEFSRKDILIPLIFSNAFGPGEKYGSVSYGLIYGHSWVNYGFKYKFVYEGIRGLEDAADEIPQGDNHYSSYGAFANIKLGYKYVYFILGMSGYYQNYGTYKLYAGETASFKGMTFVPSIRLAGEF